MLIEKQEKKQPGVPLDEQPLSRNSSSLGLPLKESDHLSRDSQARKSKDGMTNILERQVRNRLEKVQADPQTQINP